MKGEGTVQFMLLKIIPKKPELSASGKAITKSMILINNHIRPPELYYTHCVQWSKETLLSGVSATLNNTFCST